MNIWLVFQTQFIRPHALQNIRSNFSGAPGKIIISKNPGKSGTTFDGATFCLKSRNSGPIMQRCGSMYSCHFEKWCHFFLDPFQIGYLFSFED